MNRHVFVLLVTIQFAQPLQLIPIKSSQKALTCVRNEVVFEYPLKERQDSVQALKHIQSIPRSNTRLKWLDYQPRAYMLLALRGSFTFILKTLQKRHKILDQNYPNEV